MMSQACFRPETQIRRPPRCKDPRKKFERTRSETWKLALPLSKKHKQQTSKQTKSRYFRHNHYFSNRNKILLIIFHFVHFVRKQGKVKTKACMPIFCFLFWQWWISTYIYFTHSHVVILFVGWLFATFGVIVLRRSEAKRSNHGWS